MRSFSLIGLICLAMLAPNTLAQETEVESPDPTSKEAMATRLEYMTTQAQSFKGSRKKDKGKIVPMDKPLLRWTNPYSNVKDGVLVGWVDEKGLPMAVAQIYLLPDSYTVWSIELQSLSQDAFELASPNNGPWRPNKPGVTWAPFPSKKIKPADSKALRLAQMRRLAKRFRGDDNFEEKDESVLRLMPNPMVRYEDKEKGLVDGAVFALVHGTDPEMIIMVELREDKQSKKREYHYALAPMTSYELRGYLDGEEVWHKPRQSSFATSDVFWVRNLRDTPRRRSLLGRLLNF